VSNDGIAIGTVTSGTWSFLLDRGIAMARILAGSVPYGETVSVDVRGHPAQAEVVKLPFYRAASRAAAPAGS
jgi:aminomethyltransferase